MTPPGQGDAGDADPRLLAALTSRDEAALAGALGAARVFVGVESRLVELATDPPGDRTPGAAGPAGEGAQGGPAARPAGSGGRRTVVRGEKKSEMVLATLRLPSGATALPVFTSVAALSAWSPTARPVPIAALDACAEAARLGHRTVVVDVAGPVTATLDVGALVDSPRDATNPASVAGPAGPDSSASPESGAAPTDRRAASRPAPGGRAGLRPPAQPWDPERRLRVAAELDALAAAGLARGARVWLAELVTAGQPGDEVVAGEVLAVAVPAEGTGAELGFDEIARRLRGALTAGDGTDGAARPVVFVDAADVAALRGSLGRGLAARRWRRRSAPA